MQIHLMYLAMSPAEREYLPRSFVLMNKILQKEATKNRKTAEEIFQERGQISGQIIIMHPKSVDFSTITMGVSRVRSARKALQET
jgi:hypothetical protein